MFLDQSQFTKSALSSTHCLPLPSIYRVTQSTCGSACDDYGRSCPTTPRADHVKLWRTVSVSLPVLVPVNQTLARRRVPRETRVQSFILWRYFKSRDSYLLTRKLCYRKDNRAMRAI